MKSINKLVLYEVVEYFMRPRSRYNLVGVMNLRNGCFFLGLLSMLYSVEPLFSQTTRWLEGKVQGNACDESNTVIFAFGDEISWVFSELGIKLNNPRDQRTSNKFCNLTAIAEVADRNYLTELQQILTYGGIKSQWGSQGSITSSSRFFDKMIKPYQIDFPNGIGFDQPIVSITLSDKDKPFFSTNRWCRGNRPQRGRLVARLMTKGQLLGPEPGSIVINVQSFDIKYAVIMKWKQCEVIDRIN